MMKELRWAELSYERRRELCHMAQLSPVIAMQSWNLQLAPTKLRLAQALEHLSGGTATLLHDRELLDYRQWVANGEPYDW